MKIKQSEDIFLHLCGDDEKESLKLKITQSAFIYLDNWTSKHSFGNFWHLYWNSRSGATVFFEGKRIDLNSKHVYLIPAHTLFSTKLSRPVNHFYIDFTINSYFENMKYGIYAFPADYMNEKLRLFRECGDRNMRKTIIHTLIWHYLSLAGPENFTDPEEKKFDPRIARAISVMEMETGSGKTAGALCRKIGMSPANFYKMFKSETGKTPAAFFMQIRLARANHLLAHTDENIEEIARRTGFANRYHFSRRYKARTGYTPVEYRLRSPFSSKSNPDGSEAKNIRYGEEKLIPEKHERQ